MNVLVMGSTGFLGKRVTKKLDEKQINQVKLSRSLGTDFTNLQEFNSAVQSLPTKIDTIINCAALVGGIKYGLEHAAEMLYVNSMITLNLYEVARQNGIYKIINPISNCSYPRDLVGQFKEEEWWNGVLDESVATYGMVRKMSYVQSAAYFKQYGIKTINLIVPNMYGPEDHFDEVRSHALGALIRKITDAKTKGQDKVIVWGTGSPIREWLYVDDCAEAIYRSLTSPDAIEPINLGCGKGISIKNLALLIAEIVDYTGEICFDVSKPDGAPYKVMDVTRCNEYFQWLPPMSLKDGIKESAQWLSANKEHFE